MSGMDSGGKMGSYDDQKQGESKPKSMEPGNSEQYNPDVLDLLPYLQNQASCHQNGNRTERQMGEGTRVPSDDSPDPRSGQDHSCISYGFFN